MRWTLRRRSSPSSADSGAEPGGLGIVSEVDSSDKGSPATTTTAPPAAPSAHRPSTLETRLTEVDDALATLRGRLAEIDSPAETPETHHGDIGTRLRRSGGAELGGFSRPAPNAWLFREEVVVHAGPFVDLRDVHSFAQALAALPAHPRADVWGFDGSTAEIKLTASEPLELVDEDLHALPYGPRVDHADASALTLIFDYPPAPRRIPDDGPVLPLHLSG